MRRRDRIWHHAVADRPWRPAERRVVLRGFWGRLTIAIEPFVIAIFFVVLPLLLLLRKTDTAIFVAPIFAGARLAVFGLRDRADGAADARADRDVRIDSRRRRLRPIPHARAAARRAGLFRRRARSRAQRARRVGAGRPAEGARPQRTSGPRWSSSAATAASTASMDVRPACCPTTSRPSASGRRRRTPSVLRQRDLDRIRRRPDAAEAGSDEDERSLQDDDSSATTRNHRICGAIPAETGI